MQGVIDYHPHKVVFHFSQNPSFQVEMTEEIGFEEDLFFKTRLPDRFFVELADGAPLGKPTVIFPAKSGFDLPQNYS
jgi:hypothetical protein